MSQATMKKSPAMQLEPPRMENGKALRIAGLRGHYTPETMKDIFQLWMRFAPHIGNIPGQVDRVAYGLCFNALSPGGMDYLAGVEVSTSSGLPSEFPSFLTADMFLSSMKLWMPSTSGSQGPAW